MTGDVDNGLDDGMDTTRSTCGERGSTASAEAQTDGASMGRGLLTWLHDWILREGVPGVDVDVRGEEYSVHGRVLGALGTSGP